MLSIRGMLESGWLHDVSLIRIRVTASALERVYPRRSGVERWLLPRVFSDVGNDGRRFGVKPPAANRLMRARPRRLSPSRDASLTMSPLPVLPRLAVGPCPTCSNIRGAQNAHMSAWACSCRRSHVAASGVTLLPVTLVRPQLTVCHCPKNNKHKQTVQNQAII